MLPAWIEDMLPAGVRHRGIDVEGRRMAVMELGEGRPVVLVHGNPTWGFLYRQVAERLGGDGLRLIMPDLFGLGFSEWIPAEAHTLENHARWMKLALDELIDPEERMVVVAQDWGGPIGVLGAFDAAAETAGLVLMNTVVGPPREGFRPTLFHRVSQMPVVSEVLFRGLGFPQSALLLAQGDRASIRGRVARAYRYPLRNRRRNHAPLALARMVPDSLEHPSIPELRRCQQLYERFDGPIALVWGSRDPVLGRAVKRVRAMNPSATLVSTEAGHFLQEEVPDEIADAIRKVIQAGS